MGESIREAGAPGGNTRTVTRRVSDVIFGLTHGSCGQRRAFYNLAEDLAFQISTTGVFTSVMAMDQIK